MTTRTDEKAHELASKHDVCVIFLPRRGAKGLRAYYKVRIPVLEGSQHRMFLLSEEMSLKLWKRYKLFVANRAVSDEHATRTVCDQEPVLESLPGEYCEEFLRELASALKRKHEQNDIFTSWIAPPTIYNLWKYTSFVSTELFADCFNESGMLSAYCSKDEGDFIFGSVGCWEDVEDSAEGGAGNPPFTPDFLERMIGTFERGVVRAEPYCRCVILPLGARHKVLDRLRALTSEAILLAAIPPGCFPFMNEHTLLYGDHLKPKPHIFQTVGLVIWRNREYLLRYPPPLDVEEVYKAWVDNTLHEANKVVLYEDAFLRAFPKNLRSPDRIAASFLEELVRL